MELEITKDKANESPPEIFGKGRPLGKLALSIIGLQTGESIVVNNLEHPGASRLSNKISCTIAYLRRAERIKGIYTCRKVDENTYRVWKLK